MSIYGLTYENSINGFEKNYQSNPLFKLHEQPSCIDSNCNNRYSGGKYRKR